MEEQENNFLASNSDVVHMLMMQAEALEEALLRHPRQQ